MRASDFEISNYSKLDKILSKLCEMVVKGQQSEKDYGMVAAAVLDPDNQIVARLNRPGDNGKRIHAEHAAMEDYETKYGPIPEGSIVITTLSPCNASMDERDGPSCTSIINNSSVRKVYCGYMDPTQDDDTRQFNLMETADKSIRIKCKQFADTFLGDVHETQTLEERRKKKRQTRRAAYGPGLFGGYGYYSDYGNSDGGGDGGGGESMKNENFADGKNPQDKGDSKRHGVPTKASVSTLRKVAKQGGRKGQLAHWMANMKSGKKK